MKKTRKAPEREIKSGRILRFISFSFDSCPTLELTGEQLTLLMKGLLIASPVQ